MKTRTVSETYTREASKVNILSKVNIFFKVNFCAKRNVTKRYAALGRRRHPGSVGEADPGKPRLSVESLGALEDATAGSGRWERIIGWGCEHQEVWFRYVAYCKRSGDMKTVVLAGSGRLWGHLKLGGVCLLSGVLLVQVKGNWMDLKEFVKTLRYTEWMHFYFFYSLVAPSYGW